MISARVLTTASAPAARSAGCSVTVMTHPLHGTVGTGYLSASLLTAAGGVNGWVRHPGRNAAQLAARRSAAAWMGRSGSMVTPSSAAVLVTVPDSMSL